MRKRLWITFVFIVLLAIGAGVVDWPKGPNISIGSYFKELKVRLGLDLSGGTHLVYEADVSVIAESERNASLEGVRDVVERRVNFYGVSEPVVQTAHVGDHYRVIIELPGVTDVSEAIALIGETPLLEFKEQQPAAAATETSGEEPVVPDGGFVGTGLTGTHLKSASVNFDQNTGVPQVVLSFNDEGKTLFAEITKRNLGQPVAIYLDGVPISIPVVQTEITDGQAVISGDFTLPDAKLLAGRLNSGALPVPISLVSQENIGATLGRESVERSLLAGLIGIAVVSLFMIAYYRLPGLYAVVALALYSLVVLALFKLFSFTLTLAGVAGFILSIGMAVDANVLIFERMREERRAGRDPGSALEEGFRRAWNSIRDSNVSSLITCVILVWFGTSLIKGFALTLALGIVVSMFSAIIVTRTLMRLFYVRAKGMRGQG